MWAIQYDHLIWVRLRMTLWDRPTCTYLLSFAFKLFERIWNTTVVTHGVLVQISFFAFRTSINTKWRPSSPSSFSRSVLHVRPESWVLRFLFWPQDSVTWRQPYMCACFETSFAWSCRFVFITSILIYKIYNILPLYSTKSNENYLLNQNLNTSDVNMGYERLNYVNVWNALLALLLLS